MASSPYKSSGVPATAGPGFVQGSASVKPHDDIFKTTEWRDLWAAVLYLVSLAAFVGIAFVNISYLVANTGSFKAGDGAVKLLLGLLISALSAACGAAAVSGLLLFAAYKAPEATITGCYLSLVVVLVFEGIRSLIEARTRSGVLALLMAGLDLFLYFLWRKHIPFSAVLLRWATRTLGEYPAMLLANFGMVCLLIVKTLAFAASAVGGYLMHENRYRSDAYVNGTLVYSFFWYLWSEEIVQNVARVTTSGVFACRYFLGCNSLQAPNPTRESFGRATTYSFGSIAFGSLLVATITFLGALFRNSAERGSLAGIIVDCFLSMVESLLRYFNTYAFTQIAIYGKPYIEAAKLTWDLVKRNGMDAIINDNLIGSFVVIASLLSGLIGGELGRLVFRLYDGRADISAVGYAVGFLASAVVSWCALNIISAGVTTLFVCLAEDPAALSRTDAETYQKLASRYSNLNL